MISNSMYKLVFFLMLAIIVGCSSETSDKQKEAKGQNKPEPSTPAGYVQQATFTDLDGNPVSLSKFEGKVVMIDFWETWCKPCIASFPTLEKLQKEYSENFVVLAVTPGFTDTQEDAQAFANNHDYPFTYLMDSNNLHQKLGVRGIPYKVFVDPQGKLIKQSRGSYGPKEDYKQIKKIIEKYKKL